MKLSPENPDGWQATADQLLMTMIKDKRQITYNQLATAAELTGPHRIHRLTSWLEQTMAEDQKRGRPLRAAVDFQSQRRPACTGFCFC